LVGVEVKVGVTLRNGVGVAVATRATSVGRSSVGINVGVTGTPGGKLHANAAPARHTNANQIDGRRTMQPSFEQSTMSDGP